MKERISHEDMSAYRRLVRKLLYLTIFRPDIAYFVHQLSQFLDCPTLDHVTAAHRVLQYLKWSIGKGLFYSSNSTGKLQAFSNAD